MKRANASNGQRRRSKVGFRSNKKQRPEPAAASDENMAFPEIDLSDEHLHHDDSPLAPARDEKNAFSVPM
jgi:hypothetical protein